MTEHFADNIDFDHLTAGQAVALEAVLIKALEAMISYDTLDKDSADDMAKLLVRAKIAKHDQFRRNGS